MSRFNFDYTVLAFQAGWIHKATLMVLPALLSTVAYAEVAPKRTLVPENAVVRNLTTPLNHPVLELPQVTASQLDFIPTVLIPQTQDSTAKKIDVSMIDDFIIRVARFVSHYPPKFPNRTQKYNTREKIKGYVAKLQPYAEAPNASYEVLLRATKLNGMARNLDMGSDFAVRGANYIDRAIKLRPQDGEAQFLYGVMLAEGGGFKSGIKYLQKAESLGHPQAKLSLAQAYLLTDRREDALVKLNEYKSLYPNDTKIDARIDLVNSGSYYLWDIPIELRQQRSLLQ